MSTLDIDINDLNSQEIRNVLHSYPNGHLLIKFDRVFWSVEMSNNQYKPSAPSEKPEHGYTNEPKNKQQPNDPFGRMGSTLMSMVTGK